MVGRIKKQINPIVIFRLVSTFLAATNKFGISAKHDMSIERNLTKSAFSIYFIAGRKGFSSPSIDFPNLSSVTE
jgi:hypothetical protein